MIKWKEFGIIVGSILIFRLLREAIYVGKNFEQCIGSYMEKNGLLEDGFKADSFNGSAAICRIMINIRLGIHYYCVNEAYEILNYTQHEKKCIGTKISESMFAEYAVKELLYEYSTQMSKKDLEKRKKAMKKAMTSSLNTAVDQCTKLKFERSFFDHIFNISKKSHQILTENNILVMDYCFKRYIEKNRLLQSDFDITPFMIIDQSSPTFANESFCRHDVIEPSKKVIEEKYLKSIEIEGFNIKIQMCIMKQLKKHPLVEKLTAVAFASAFGMTEDEKEEELLHYETIYRGFLEEFENNCYE